MKKLIFATLFTLLVSVAAQAQVGSNACDPSLWPRVYSHYRFNPGASAKNQNEPAHRCVQIRGRIERVYPVSDEGDGDIHISIVPDNRNVLRAHQTALVVEIVCADNTPGIGPAQVTCKGYHIPPHLSYARISRFRKGQHVEIVGELLVDYEHLRTGWTEIHPVTRIDPID